MKHLTLAQVKAAGLPAYLRLGQLTYEYRPALDSVAVFFGASRRPCLSVSHRIPLQGWLHEVDCACRLCREEQTAPSELPPSQAGRSADRGRQAV